MIQNHEKYFIAAKASVLAGAEIMKVYASSDFEVEQKKDNSPLTLADRKAHLKIMEFIANLGFPVLSEEGKNIAFEERKNWDTFWLVDPLDGTKEFINKNGEFTVNIALVKNGEPVFGVIYVPVYNNLYIGGKDEGAYKLEKASDAFSNIKNLTDLFSISDKLQKKSDGEPYTVVGSRSHMSEETLAFVEEIKKEHANVEMVSKGSSLKFCLMAEGTAQQYPRFGPTMEWDTGAGHAIAMAAGCEVIAMDTNKPLLYNKENLLNPFFLVR